MHFAQNKDRYVQATSRLIPPWLWSCIYDAVIGVIIPTVSDIIELDQWHKKVIIKHIQSLTSVLHLLNKAIVLGWEFTFGMYADLKLVDKDGCPLKQHHHMWLGKQFIHDCKIWGSILTEVPNHALCRPFVDVDQFEFAHILNNIAPIIFLYKGDPTYIGTFPVDSRMPLIFKDFQHSTLCRPTSCWKICEYQSHP